MGLTQSELAVLAKVKQASLSELETGESKRPRGDTLVRIAKALDVDPDWLITGVGRPTRATQTDDDQNELLLMWKDLTTPNRGALMAAARALLSSQPKPTKTLPHRVTVKPK